MSGGYVAPDDVAVPGRCVLVISNYHGTQLAVLKAPRAADGSTHVFTHISWYRPGMTPAGTVADELYESTGLGCGSTAAPRMSARVSAAARPWSTYF